MDGLVLAAALSGALAVVAGARGAHGASGPAAEWLKTGGQYQLVHAVAAIAVLALPWGRVAGRLFVAGGGLFAATLYGLAFGAPLWLGAITPVGGLLMILGWLALGWGAARG